MTGMLGDHLWQSTLFALFAAALTLALKRNRAQARYALWLAASAKFLIPFAVLAAAGANIGWSPSGRSFDATPPTPSPTMWAVETITRPFSSADVHATPAVAVPHAASTVLLFNVLSTIWAIGAVAIFATWIVRWLRVASLARRGTRLDRGREIDALRRLEWVAGIRRQTALVVCDEPVEPGIFGIVRPVLLWPSAISEKLSDEQIEAIIAHEVTHIRRRDNLAAAVHMVIEALFWFHPLVWWIGARLVDERERACDEEVVRLGSEPQVYAESIVKTCRLSIESSLACVAGVTGSDLTRRIEAIMNNHTGDALTKGKRTLLAAAAVAALVWPIAIGTTHAPRLLAQAQQTSADESVTFEVASVKPNKSGDPRVMLGGGPGGRFNATNVPLRLLIRNAYALQDSQLVGGPGWVATERFDIVAKAEGTAFSPMMAPGRPGPIQYMMRNLLKERFKLTTHAETREQPIYALVLARTDGKLGPQLRKSEVDCAAMAAARGRGGPPAAPAPGERMQCGMRMGPGQLSGGGFPLSQLGTTMSQLVQRMVVDRTGLAGNFDIDLTWTPEPGQGLPPGPPPPGAPALPPIDPNGPSLFTALQEQLGLKLESTRGPVEVLVIDSVEMPSPD